MSTQEGNLTPQADDTVASLPLEEAIACSQLHGSSVSSPVKKKAQTEKKRIIERAVDAAQMSEYIWTKKCSLRSTGVCTLAHLHAFVIVSVRMSFVVLFYAPLCLCVFCASVIL